ncbi:MAG: lipid A deacylase LpxR family protein [Bacteroidales bacterium]
MNQRYFITLSLFLALQVSLSAQQETYQNAFSVAFENDMFNKMDWYYTNGLQFLLYHKSLQKSPFDRVLLPFKIREKDRAWYGLKFRQELYTPRDLDDDTIRAGDHPYAATLTLTQQRVVNRPESGIRFTTGLRVGILGPAALGFHAQDIIHRITPSNPPKGWDYQVQNDVILNYDFIVDKEILRDGVSILGLKGMARMGTLHTDFSGGIWYRLDMGQDYFERLGPNPDKPFNLYFQMEGTGRLVIYDATLQGGLFNKTSPYVIPAESINRLVGDIIMSLVCEIRGHQVGLYQHLISSSFTESGWHGWLGINYTYWW